MGVLGNNALVGASAAGAAGGDFYSHQIANSCRFQPNGGSLDSTEYLYRTQGTPTNVDKCTISFWVKRSELGSRMYGMTGSGASGQYSYMTFGGDGSDADKFYWLQNPGSPTIVLESNPLFRDTSAWYNIIVAQDSTQSTDSDRNKIYINGVQLTDWGTGFTPSFYSTLNSDFLMNTSGHKIFVGSGGDSAGGAYLPFDGYIAEYVFIDGTQYASTDFGEMSNGVWIAKDPSGLTFGNNGCYLKMATGAIGTDSSGNGNNFTVSNIEPHDVVLDSPTFNSTSNGGNFMTYNGAWIGSNNTLAEGNLKSTGSAGGNTSGTFGMLTGKWYWECRAETVNSYGPTFGIGQSGIGNTDGQYYVITWQTSAGQIYGGGGVPLGMGTISVTSTGVTSLSSGDIMSFWLDCDNGKLWIGKNGAIPNSGDPASGSNPQASWSTIPTDRYFTATCQNVGSGVGVLNAGQNPSFNGAITAGTNTDKNGYGLFNYDPSGTDFVACCAANISISAQIDPAQNSDDYPQKTFGPFTYVGNNDGDRTITTGFQPDKVWIKVRSIVDNNYIQDSTRGFGFSKSISTNSTGLEGANGGAPTTTKVDSVSSSNIVVTGPDFTYQSATYVAWLWRANGGTTVTNTQGSEDSTVQTDPSGHFSIVKWTGTNNSWGNSITVGHGLNAAPNVMLCKQYTGNTDQWEVFFSSYGTYSIGGSNAACNSLRLDTDAALYTNQSYKTFGGVMPTSTVFTVDGNNLNRSGSSIIAYCFANCEGYIKVGTYVGNADADGIFVYTGFEPAFFMCKPLPAGNWRIKDIARSPYNVTQQVLYPNHTYAEENYTSDNVDILSNGFKMRASDTTFNQATTYVYLAMAHNPFKYSLAR